MQHCKQYTDQQVLGEIYLELVDHARKNGVHKELDSYTLLIPAAKNKISFYRGINKSGRLKKEDSNYILNELINSGKIIKQSNRLILININ